jgi:hypothetical protein
MAEVFDILLEPDFDLMISDGDFVVGESTKQHQLCLLTAEPGNYKQSPTLGVGAFSFINDDETLQNLKAAIQKTFEADGMIIDHLSITADGNIDVEANY